MRASSRTALKPLAMSRATPIEVAMPPIADQSILSAPLGNGCVEAAILSREVVGTPF